MHFSIRQEMEPLDRFLSNVEREGLEWFKKLVGAGLI